MATAKELLAHKIRNACRPLCTIPPGATVLEAVVAMNRERIGALVVVEAGDPGVLAGIFTERDVLTRVVGEQRDPAATRVADVMTSDPITCTPGMSLEEIRATITRHRVRHLPVLDQGRLVGMVTGGDVLAYDVTEQQQTIRDLHNYITS